MYVSQDALSWKNLDTNVTIPYWPEPFDGFKTSTDYLFLYIQIPNQGIYWNVRAWEQIKSVPADELIANFPIGILSPIMVVRYQGNLVT